MTTRRTAAEAVSVALLMALSGAGPALAQTPTDVDTITVVAPRITYQVKRVGDSAIPKEVTVAKKSALVAFNDLDLTRTADLYQLEDRVGKAAVQVCGELAQEFPEGTPSTETCTRRAIDDAMARVQMVARQKARSSASSTARDEGGN